MAHPSISEILAAVPQPMLYLDDQGVIDDANTAAKSLLGDWIYGRSHVAVLRQPALLALLEATYAGGPGGEARYVEAGQSGQSIYRVVVTVLNRTTKPSLLLHFSDITHLREVEEMRRDFVANVSHELRTPLTAILGFIETLRGPASADPEAQNRFLGIMEDEARRMNRIVSDLLSLSRVEGQERIRPDDRVALDDLIQSTVAALKPQAEEAQSRIEIEGPEAPIMVRGDSDQLMQVLMNLTENALKYGGRDKPVVIRLSNSIGTGTMKGPVAQIEVIDHGDGIDPVHLPRLTERFYRIDTHRSRAMGGTGLGLAIVKHIVNRHRGRLKIYSEQGVGSRFLVMLPVE